MNDRDPIIEDELRLLSEVAEAVDAPTPTFRSEDQIVADLLRLRDELPGAKTEDKGALMEQYDRLVAILEQLRRGREGPEIDPSSPYFAHLRLADSESGPWDLCLGKATLLEDDVRIVDWRNAPISRVFYGYRQGDRYREEFGGRNQEGRILARRMVTISEGALVRVEAPEGVFRRGAGGEWSVEPIERKRMVGGEGIAVRVHAADEGIDRRLGADLEGNRRRLDKRLPDIAGLLDPEQFDLITRPTAGILAIRGAAGSGKTTVALHRIAWMAHEDAAVDSPSTLVLVFSPALRDYVGHVLPSLGVKRVQVTTFEEWSRDQCLRHFRNLPRAFREATAPVLLRLKLHPVIRHALEAHIARTPGRPTRAQAIDDWMSVLLDRALLEETVARHAPGTFSTGELSDAVRTTRDHMEAMGEWLEGDRRSGAELDAEDPSLLLWAWRLRVGPLRGEGKKALRYRHIAIDEVQDFSALELRLVIGCLDEHQSLTLAGDTQQHVMPYSGFTSWQDLFGQLEIEGMAIDTLQTAYRSTHEILCFATGLLGELIEDAGETRSTRTGPPVELFRFTDDGACVAFLADVLEDLLAAEPLASVALLTPDPDISATYHDGLAKARVRDLRLILDQRFTFRPGVDVTEIEQVKGLEFDYVILIDVSAAQYPEADDARRLLHVGATRAVHQLWLTTVGPPSPIVQRVLDRRS